VSTTLSGQPLEQVEVLGQDPDAALGVHRVGPYVDPVDPTAPAAGRNRHVAMRIVVVLPGKLV
jgi:hypothetical protein